jgi:hypothetical protein
MLTEHLEQQLGAGLRESGTYPSSSMIRKLEQQQVLLAEAAAPIGKPAFDQASGRLIAGWPVMFCRAVNGT